MEQRATRPKLSDFAFSSLRMDATPTPSAMMKATERKFRSETAARTKTSA